MPIQDGGFGSSIQKVLKSNNSFCKTLIPSKLKQREREVVILHSHSADKHEYSKIKGSIFQINMK